MKKTLPREKNVKIMKLNLTKVKLLIASIVFVLRILNAAIFFFFITLQIIIVEINK